MAGTPASSRGAAATPTARELLSSPSSTAIAASDSAALTWAKDDGDTLLNVSDSDLPVVVTTGVYAVTVTVRGAGMTSAGSYRARLELDRTGDTANAYGTANAVATLTDPEVTLCLVYYMEAGAEIEVFVANFDVDFVSFSLKNVVVQQLA